MYDKSQDNFSTALLTMIATVVGVQVERKKDRLSIRCRVDSPPRRSADCRNQK